MISTTRTILMAIVLVAIMANQAQSACPGVRTSPVGQPCDDDNPCPSNLECNEDDVCACPTSPSQTFWNNEECLPCPGDWNLQLGHCYKLYKDRKTWADSEAYCVSQGSHLIKIDNAAENSLLYNYYVANTGSPNDRIWTGARSYTPYQFVWSLDNTAFSRNSPFWCANEPNNHPDGSLIENHEPCVFMWTAGGQVCLNDYQCMDPQYFLCEKS